MRPASNAAPARRDILLICTAWACACAWTLWYHWLRVQTLAFPDPDDAMRMKEVLDLLGGQSWWDMRQYAVDPPGGTDMHWSRLVDLPLLGILRFALPVLGRDDAMRLAGAAAPLLPMLVAMQAIGVAARRLVAPSAGVVAALCLWLAPGPSQMWDPMRVDHHGWQIALACAMLAAIAGRRTARSGIAAAGACCLSISIGMETAPVVAVAAGAIVLRWVRTGETSEPRSFAAGTAAMLPIGYGLFASEGSSRLLCDALTPVWTWDGTLGACILLAATFGVRTTTTRTASILVAAVAVAVFHALHSPGCVMPTEHISPEARRLWFGTNRETVSVLALDWSLILLTAWHAGVSTWGTVRGLRGKHPERWATPAAMLAVTIATTLWRMRGGPLAQAMGTPGVAMAAWTAIEAARGLGPAPRRLVASAVAVSLASGNAVVLADAIASSTMPMPRMQAAIYECTEGTRIERLDRLPGDLILADLYESPRISLLTRHRTLAGPYHRDADAVVDLLLDWKDPPERVREQARSRGIQLVVACPEGEERLGAASFHDQLVDGRLPWTRPVDVPGLAPLKAWRIVDP